MVDPLSKYSPRTSICPVPTPSVPPQLACPRSGESLILSDDRLICGTCGEVARYSSGVWDFIDGPSYVESFGVQWTKFSSTQLDSMNGTGVSRDRFMALTGWTERDLGGLSVLDAGCGAGRFSEVALAMGGTVTALELSAAAYATLENFPVCDALEVVRGDLLCPPLQPRWFDRVYSIGVLQHTPEPAEGAQSLLRLVKPGGKLTIWMYERRWYSPLLPKYALRKLTTRLSPTVVSRVTAALVAGFTPVARATRAIRPPAIRRAIRAALPIASYWGELPLTAVQQREWSLLDTYDWLTPKYDRPLNYEELSAALLAAGASSVMRVDAPGLCVQAIMRGV